MYESYIEQLKRFREKQNDSRMAVRGIGNNPLYECYVTEQSSHKDNELRLNKRNMKGVITKEFLDTIDYNDLEGVLKEHGIEKAFKAGDRKSKIIRKALKLALVVQEAKNNDIDPDEALLVQEEEDREDSMKTQEEKIEELKVKIEVEKEEVKSEEDKLKIAIGKLSNDQINSTIRNINLNLKNLIPAQRIILLGKKQFLMEELDTRGDE